MHPMLRPQDSATRERKALDGLWRFRLDVDGVGRAERWFAEPLREAQDMAVPASYNDLLADSSVRDHVGEVWYQRTVRVPRGWAGQRVVLYFESATHRATVWVGEEEVVRHEGGYTPFEADVTAAAPAGELVRMTVCVDNRLSFQTIPPGVVEQTATGPRQRYWHDFYNYAGLHRTVWLACTPAARIEDVTVVNGLDGATGSVDYRVEAADADGLDVRVVLRDADGVPVGTATGAAGVVSVPDVHPWAPGDGYLYDLEVQLVDPAGALVDSYHQSVGVRTVEVRGTEFLINGAPFRFTGFGMHEDHPTLGKGHNPAFLVQDFALLSWIGANSFRTSHYPYSEDVLDLADRNGVVVIDETAAVGLNMGLGGGIFGAPG
jgi:beta-glucuronidase